MTRLKCDLTEGLYFIMFHQDDFDKWPHEECILPPIPPPQRIEDLQDAPVPAGKDYLDRLETQTREQEQRENEVELSKTPTVKVKRGPRLLKYNRRPRGKNPLKRFAEVRSFLDATKRAEFEKEQKEQQRLHDEYSVRVPLEKRVFELLLPAGDTVKCPCCQVKRRRLRRCWFVYRKRAAVPAFVITFNKDRWYAVCRGCMLTDARLSEARAAVYASKRKEGFVEESFKCSRCLRDRLTRTLAVSDPPICGTCYMRQRRAERISNSREE